MLGKRRWGKSDLVEHTPPLSADPFGTGWLFKIAPSNWEAEKTTLMTAEEYFPVMEEKIVRGMKK
ncbi:MAG: glycine cleavage system protein H [Pelotomaculum sp. PtaB.Bin104]|nr:MAG: glycine cleavage system protein H [Pelotomaculum sp. PtaB.Bin104]